MKHDTTPYPKKKKREPESLLSFRAWLQILGYAILVIVSAITATLLFSHTTQFIVETPSVRVIVFISILLATCFLFFTLPILLYQHLKTL